MTTKLYSHNGFLSSSSSNPWNSHKPARVHYSCNKAFYWGHSKKRCLIRLALLEHNDPNSLKLRVVEYKNCYLSFQRGRRLGNLLCRASAEDGVTVNGSPPARTNRDVEEMKVNLNQSLSGKDSSDGLVQFLHEAARVFELAIKEQGSFSKSSWFSTAWLNGDSAWVKALSYQASVYSLLQAASEIASRGDGRDRDINVFVQKSLLRQSATLETLIRDHLSAKQPEAYEWLCSEQVPLVITSFVNYFEKDPHFTAATNVSEKGILMGSSNASDITLLMLALSCNAAITKIGQSKISSPQFFSTIPDITGRLMDALVDFIPVSQAYQSIKDIGLRREFLVHFGPRAAACRVKNDGGSEEVVFWVDLVQRQLQRAIDRERIWSRLTTSESIEVLERDLAIFGFFIALGRSTQSFLSANGFDVLDDPLEGYVRFLIGGSVLYYPQLSSISSYQLYVEVVCEELDWFQFYPGISGTPKQSHGHRKNWEGPPNAEAIPQLFDVCFHWMQSFIKYSTWLESPSNVKAARFLSRGHKKLLDCMEEQGVLGNVKMENFTNKILESTVSRPYSSIERELDSFDKALESVDGALIRLEQLLQDLHVSNSNSGKEHIKAACSDLEKIRKLKKEAKFLEASFRAKAASLRQEDDDNNPSGGSQKRSFKGKKRKSKTTDGSNSYSGLWSSFRLPPTRKLNADLAVDESVSFKGKKRKSKTTDGSNSYSGLWSSFRLPPTRKLNADLAVDESENETVSNIDAEEIESNKFQRFELLRNELIELEKRVQRSADPSDNEEDVKSADDSSRCSNDPGAAQLVKVQRKDNFIERSLDKLKETSTDVWQGTQLLAIDVGAATGLLRRVLIGDELTEKEKKVLRRTVTDVASVVPIGVLMLLPVTAVGHAAMLAAIQRYVPSLIPSTYGSERLDLLRKIQKMKMESSEDNSNESMEEKA